MPPRVARRPLNPRDRSPILRPPPVLVVVWVVVVVATRPPRPRPLEIIPELKNK